MSHTPPRHKSVDAGVEEGNRFVVIARRMPRQRSTVSPLRATEDSSEEAPPPPRSLSSSRRQRSSRGRRLPSDNPSTLSPALVPIGPPGHHSHPVSCSPPGLGGASAVSASSGGATPSASAGHGAPQFIPNLSSRALNTTNLAVADINTLLSTPSAPPPREKQLPTIFTVTSASTNISAPLSHPPLAQGAPGIKGVSTNPAARGTLFERRNRLEFGSISLSMETFIEEAPSVSASPPCATFRGWSKIPNRHLSSGGLPPSVRSASSLKIVSYNVLAQHLVTTDNYPLCPPSALTEEHRVPLLMEELRQAEADIICLSEMSVKSFSSENSLGHFLYHSLGFDGYHVANTSLSGTVTCVSTPYSKRGIPSVTAGERDSEDDHHGDADPMRQETDGVAIFFDNERFELLEEQPIYFNRLGAADMSLLPSERKNLLVKTHNVALILVLRDLKNPKWIFVVGTSHITWRRCESQLWQFSHLLKAMERLKYKHGGAKPPPPPAPAPQEEEGRNTYSRTVSDLTAFNEDVHVACLLVGDFNMEPPHPAFEYARNGALPNEAEVVKAWRTEGQRTPPAETSSATAHPPHHPHHHTVAASANHPSPPPTKPTVVSRPHRAPASTGAVKSNTYSTWPPPLLELGASSEEPQASTLGAKPSEFLRDLLGVEAQRRIVYSADTGEGESPLKTRAGDDSNPKHHTPPGPRRRDISAGVPCTPLKVWQRSGSSFEEMERGETNLHDFSDTHSVLSDTEAPTGVMGLAEQSSVTTLMLPPACTPQKRHFSSQYSDSHSSESSDAETPEGESPIPRRSNHVTAPPPPSGGEKRHARGFVRRSERKRNSTSLFSPSTIHHLRFKSAYETYLARHPRRVTAHTSGANEGKVIDHVLYDHDLLRTVSVVRLGERGSNLPSWNCPSDHFMVGAQFYLTPSPSASTGG